MGFFDKVLGGAKRVVANVTNMDLLQAISAASLYVAASDGKIDSKELDQLRVSLATNAKLASFTESQIGSLLGQYRQKLEESPRQGKIAMRKEIEDITDAAQAETVFAVACDVADQDGISDVEKARLVEIAGWLRVNPADFGL